MTVDHARIPALMLSAALAACSANSGDANSNRDADAATDDAPAIYRADSGIDHDAELLPCILPDGTMGMPEPFTADFTPDSAALLEAASATPPADLPDAVHLRTATESYNRAYWFALRDGRVWYRPNREVTGEDAPWAAAVMPACLLDGSLIAISADDDELIALRANGDIYGMDNILKDASLFNWTSRWGPPVWLGTGYHVPEDVLSWSWSVISPAEDENWTDPAGNRHAVGQGKVSHIWVLRDGGQRYTYIDPWLPKDEAYEMCGPLRGRFRAMALSTSGSTVFTIGAYGDMATRHYDFELSGADDVFFSYSYDDQRGVPNPAIQLPTFDWQWQPKIDGTVTDAISLHKVGKDMINRILRVEGMNAAGQTGYWEKDITELERGAWQFVVTGQPLRGRILDNPGGDTRQRDSGPDEDVYYARNLEALAELDADAALDDDADWAGELLDFNVYCSPAVLRIHTAPGESMDLLLHSTDVIRQTEPRARGLDDNPRGFSGNIEIPAALLDNLDALSPRQREFVRLYLDDARHTSVDLSGVTGAITVTDFGWVFEAAGAP